MRNSEQQAAYSADPRVIAVIALGSFFGLFTFSMTLATVRYIFINQTNVDVLKSKTLLHQLAIRVPRDTPPDPRFKTVTYPLPTHVAIPSSNGTASDSSNTTNQTPATDKDRLATRTFAIVKTQMGENPWDLGLYANWVSIMGTNVFEWVLPLHQSPCVGEESSESFYRLGPLYPELRRRYGLPDLRPARKGREMRQRRR
jgi:palmitoyltransferase